ncbi:fumarylacetoacetate hydrolase family protein [Novosphingobium colocasiae]|uniref:fumarylacetoacetate hydrolase family protein n=1 Tax=Novosphingobium colocasiae TaxID=1256513 RepID=UPI0035B36769
MMDSEFVITAPPRVSIPVAGEQRRFPVNRIFCVGRNYADHAREMGSDPDREPPFFFLKSPEAIIADGGPLAYPPQTANLHFEVELVVAIGSGGADITVGAALDHVFGYAVGLDMTRRDVQDVAKAGRRPWDLAKNFAGAAPVGELVRAARHPAADDAITLEVDGSVKQSGVIGAMIWSVPEIIAALSGYQPLHAGDLIFTGTPAGVGAVDVGAVMTARVAGLPMLTCAVIPAV